MDAPSRILLRVLSGPHAGAEVALADGTYVIGGADPSDIVLPAADIAPQHARLVVSGDATRARLTAIDGALFTLAGEAQGEADLAPFQCITLGNVHLAVGPADGNWPTIELPAATAAGSASVPRNTPDDGSPQTEADADEAAAETTVSPPATPAKSGTAVLPNSRRRSLLVPALALLLLALCLLPVMAIALTGEEAPPPVNRASQLALLEKEATQIGGNQVTVADRKNRYWLEGFVADPAVKKKLVAAARAIEPGIRVRVWDGEGLARMAADILRMHRMEVPVKAGRPGELIVSGPTPDAEQWRRIHDRLLADLPSQVTLTEAFGVEAQPDAAAESAASQPPPIAVAEPRPAAPLPTPVAAPRKPQEEQPVLPAISGVSVGRTASLTLANGQRVYPGAILPNGFSVAEIDAHQIILSKGGKRYIVKIGS